MGVNLADATSCWLNISVIVGMRFIVGFFWMVVLLASGTSIDGGVDDLDNDTFHPAGRPDIVLNMLDTEGARDLVD